MSKDSATRVVGRRRPPASEDGSFTEIEQLVANTQGTEQPRPPDPAALVAEAMLKAAMDALGLEPDQLCQAGLVATILVPTGDWVGPARKAWLALTSGEVLARMGAAYVNVEGSGADTYTFEAPEAPSASDASGKADLFENVTYRGRGAIGFTPDLAWLPPDLVFAADHRLMLSLPSPEMLHEAATRLTGSQPTLEITVDETAAMTPRLLRLAVRPGQTSDDYLTKLRALVGRKAEAEQPPARSRSRTVRERPDLDRLHGMDEAVHWGRTLGRDLAAYTVGQLPWSDVDRGLLLSGSTGVGKSLYARALAASCGVPLLAGSYAAWIGTGTGHQGDLIRSMRAAFREAKERAPSILAIDEVDSFSDRARVVHSYREWDVQVTNALLAEIDGIEGREGVVLVAMCNDPSRLDPALVRAGRLDRHIKISLPDRWAVALILREHLGADLRDEPTESLAMLALGSTGADVEKVVRGARRRARTSGRPMERGDVLAELLGGVGRTSAQLLLISTHEAGHAVAAHVLGIPIQGMTLREVGLQSGGTHTSLKDVFLSAADIQDHLVVLLAGRAAEEVVLHRVTSAAGGSYGSDLGFATRLAAASAVELGLEEDHGLVWAAVPHLPEELRRLLADDPRLAALVRERLAGAYATALNLVDRHRGPLVELAQRLRERHALAPEEVGSILRAAGCRS